VLAPEPEEKLDELAPEPELPQDELLPPQLLEEW
jgi:hypothetical protein